MFCGLVSFKKTKNSMERAYNDLEWVKKVLNSSKTQQHIDISVKIYENFVNKWKNTLEYYEMVVLKSDFNTDLRKIIKKLSN
jgi:phosphoribosylformimino-5-aminoimidazole carboxamide ribonucleotide (ProFAR) isomerase